MEDLRELTEIEVDEVAGGGEGLIDVNATNNDINVNVLSVDAQIVTNVQLSIG